MAHQFTKECREKKRARAKENSWKEEKKRRICYFNWYLIVLFLFF